MSIERRIRKAEDRLRVGTPDVGTLVVILVSPEGTAPEFAEPVEQWLSYREQLEKGPPPAHWFTQLRLVHFARMRRGTASNVAHWTTIRLRARCHLNSCSNSQTGRAELDGSGSMGRTNTTKRNERQQDSEKADKSPLTDRQRRAIPFIITSATYTEGCRCAKLDPKTFYAWLKGPAFKAELDQQRGEAATEAFGVLSQGLTKAVEILVGLLDKKDDRVRRPTAKDVIDFIIRRKENEDLDRRVTEVEKWLVEQPRR